MIKRQKIESKTTENFIGGWSIDKKICEDIIIFYENNLSDVRDGESGRRVEPEVKLSQDLTIKPKDMTDKKYKVFVDYMNLLKDCYTDYIKQYPHLKRVFSKVECSAFNVQKYYEGGHFKKFHMERSDITVANRVFAWMTYLNDVEDGGTTDYLFYDLSIKPEAGKTLIWPGEWTHAHRGGIVNKGVKYIITGWFYMTDQIDFDINSPTYGLPK